MDLKFSSEVERQFVFFRSLVDSWHLAPDRATTGREYIAVYPDIMRSIQPDVDLASGDWDRVLGYQASETAKLRLVLAGYQIESYEEEEDSDG